MAEVSTMLAEATRLNASGQHGGAMKLAYEASEQLAAAYLFNAIGQILPPNDATYDLFAKTIRATNCHAALRVEISGLVGDVSALREIYEPALLDDTTSEEATQMIERVALVTELVRSIGVLVER